MAGEAKRQRRAMWVTKALLLGYTIGPYPAAYYSVGKEPNSAGYILFRPNGLAVREDMAGVTRSLPRPIRFAAPWVAAQRALVLSGVDLDENTSSS